MHWQLISVGTPFSCRSALQFTLIRRQNRPNSTVAFSLCFQSNRTVNRVNFIRLSAFAIVRGENIRSELFRWWFVRVYMWQHRTHAQAKVTGAARRHNQIHTLRACIFPSFDFVYLWNRCVRESDNTKRGWYISETHIQLFFFIIYSWTRKKELKIFRSQNIVCGLSKALNSPRGMASSSKNDAWKTWEKSGRAEL